MVWERLAWLTDVYNGGITALYTTRRGACISGTQWRLAFHHDDTMSLFFFAFGFSLHEHGSSMTRSLFIEW